jgi:hypothetical protein
MEEHLKEQILEIIEDAQNRTFLRYRNTRASNQDIKSDSATRKPASSESMMENNVSNMLQPPAAGPQLQYSPGRNLPHSAIFQDNEQNNGIFDSSSTENHFRTDSWNTPAPRRTTDLTATSPSILALLGRHMNDPSSTAAQSLTNTYELPSFTSPDSNTLDAAMQHSGEDLSWPLPRYHEHNENHTPISQDYRFDEMNSLPDEHWNTLQGTEQLDSINWNALAETDVGTKDIPGKEKDGFELQTEQPDGSS